MFTFGYLVSSGLDRELGTDDSTQLFTTKRREDAINEGERYFADLTECLVRQTSVTCSNGVREYDLLSSATGSTTFLRMAPQGPEYRLVSSNSTASGSTQYAAGEDFPREDIESLNRSEPGWRDSTGAAMPSGWYLRHDGGQTFFGFRQPPLIGSSESGTLMVPFIAAPEQSTASTRRMFVVGGNERIDLRPYHDAVIHYAAHQLEKLRKDDQASDRQLQRFIGGVARFQEQRRHRTGHQRVVFARNYFREARRGSQIWGGDPRVDD